MKYEVRKREYNSSEWKTVAASSTWTWAKKIVDALRPCENYDFSVFVWDKEIRSAKEAAEV